MSRVFPVLSMTAAVYVFARVVSRLVTRVSSSGLLVGYAVNLLA